MLNDLTVEIRGLERQLAYGREHPYSGVCGEDDAAAEQLADLKARSFAIETGVKGAVRTSVRYERTIEEAEETARRWARSNSTGHYWAEITQGGKLVTRFNLA